MRQQPPDSRDARDQLPPLPEDDFSLSGRSLRGRAQDEGPAFDEGPSQEDIEASERAASGRPGRWLARAGVVFLIIAIASMIIPMLLVLLPLGAAPESSSSAPVRGTPALVTRVIDGRTIAVDIDGKAATVRYLGVEIPSDDLWREWAARVNAQWVDGKTVVLERDVSDTDAEGRLLRYVWLGDLLVNAGMLAVGLGTFAAQSPDLRYASDLASYEANARREKVGIWQTSGT